MDSLRQSRRIRLIVTRHEQAAAMMAATVGRLTGLAQPLCFRRHALHACCCEYEMRSPCAATLRPLQVHAVRHHGPGRRPLQSEWRYSSACVYAAVHCIFLRMHACYCGGDRHGPSATCHQASTIGS